MSASAGAILELGLEVGANADAVIAAEALIEWVRAVQAISSAFDPLTEAKVSLVSAEPACIRFKTVLEFVETKVIGAAGEALDPYPNIKKFLALNVLALPGAVIGGLLVEGLKSEDKAAAERAMTAPAVEQHVRGFFKTVQREGAITEVVIRDGQGGPVIVSIDRSEFAARSGLWDVQAEDEGERSAGGEWTVVVTHPVAISKPLTWGFMRDGLPFRAKMTDARVLQAIREGNLPLNLQEGVVMKVRVSYREKLVGQVWTPVQGSFRIEQVLSPNF